MGSAKAEGRIGSTIAGKYRLDAILGEGGMGVVFAGVHTWTDREVAIKILRPQLASERSVVRRFLNEAKAASRIRSRHVVEVLDMGEAEGEVYLVMERLHGRTLHERLMSGPLSVQAASAILLPIMHALRRAHEKGVIHRDVKPDNIYLALDEESQDMVPKLLDFGIAKIRSGNLRATTVSGMTLGTPWYMSPEQARNSSEVGPTTDVWSMAVVFFVSVTGQMPLATKTGAEALVALRRGDPTRPLKVVEPGMPKAVCDLIDEALSYKASARPTMTAFAEGLERALASLEPVEAKESPIVPREDGPSFLGEDSLVLDERPSRVHEAAVTLRTEAPPPAHPPPAQNMRMTLRGNFALPLRRPPSERPGSERPDPEGEPDSS